MVRRGHWSRSLKAARLRLRRRLERSGYAEALGWARELVLGLALAFAATTAIAQPFYVPSGSMEPTLAIGDELIAAKYAYGYSHYSVRGDILPDFKGRLFGSLPARGDVVVFYPANHPDETWVKRVIGLPGDRIQMREGRLFINGKELPLKPDGTGRVETENGTYLTVPKFLETLPDGRQHAIFKWTWEGPYDDTPVFVVPKGKLFMMGDDRDDSADSRVPVAEGGIGFVPVDNVVGRADLVLGSYDFLNADSVRRWLTSFRFSRLFTAIR